MSGGAIICGGACVCWFSRTQKCITLSTCKVEYVALGDAAKELLFLRQVWHFMLPGQRMPCFSILEDNQGAVQLFSQNPVSNSNSKHIDVHHHFLRELVRQGDISVSDVPSEYQHADIFTKALAFDVFAIHRRFLINLSVHSNDFVLPLRWIDNLMCIMFVCMFLCACECLCYDTTAGAVLSLVGCKRFGGLFRYLSDHS